ncbi:hypothetical protein HDU79_009195 [Rhizoclosmatium sp. JEL0117]|nr:hypothetical protein HDU79_009195 [Rhizoclosmatium sp. JEL0117]
MEGLALTIQVDEGAHDCDLIKLFPDASVVVRECIQLVLEVLYESAEEHPPVKSLTLVIAPFDGVADTSGSKTAKQLRLSATYFTHARHSDLVLEAKGVLVHELVHVLQFDGAIVDDKSTANGGFIEGLADYIRLYHNLNPKHWRHELDPPLPSDQWDRGYEHTAYFLRWAEKDYPHLAKRINLLLRDVEWSDNLFLALTDKSVETLWAEYLASFGLSKSFKNEFGWPNPTIRFESRVPLDAALNPFTQLYPTIADAITTFATLSQKVVTTLYATPTQSPSHVQSIHLILREMDGVAHCTGPHTHKEIHLSLQYLQSFLSTHSLQELRDEVEGVLVHELTHVWQNSCSGFPGGLLEGVADWVRLTAGHMPLHWAPKRNVDVKWDTGYATTAFFLKWIDARVYSAGSTNTDRGDGDGDNAVSFVQKLNVYINSLAQWNEEKVFTELAGETVDVLWIQYCAEELEATETTPEQIQEDNAALVRDLKTILAAIENPETDPAVLMRIAMAATRAAGITPVN